MGRLPLATQTTEAVRANGVDTHLVRRALLHAFVPGGIILVSILVGVAAIGFGRRLPVTATIHAQAQARLGESSHSGENTAEDMRLQRVFDATLKDYKANLERFEANLQLHALFIVITLLLIVRRADSLALLGNQVPLQWLHLFVPVVFAYLWLSFGFLLDALIEGRLHGIEIYQLMHPQAGNDGRILFQDAGFIDGWFVKYVGSGSIGGNVEEQENFLASTAAFLVVVLGTLVSTAHACFLAMPAIGCRRYLRRLMPTAWLPLHHLLPLVPLALLFVSHYQFAYGGQNQNWIQLYIAALTGPLTLLLLWLALIADCSQYPEGVSCLRRGRPWHQPGKVTHSRDPAAADDGTGRALSMSLLGDSLSTGFHLGPIRTMLGQVWSSRPSGWFCEAGSAPEQDRPVDNILQLAAPYGPISLRLHASPMARVDSGQRRSLLDRIKNTWHYSHQVDELLAGPLPDVVLLWIGHNNVDWRQQFEDAHPETLSASAEQFARDFRRQLDRIIEGAIATDRTIRIVVFGLVGFRSFFRVRRQAEDLHDQDPSLFPFLHTGYQYFESMKPEHREGMIHLADSYDLELQRVCEHLATDLRGSRVELTYSDALNQADLGTPESLHAADAWHPSLLGHSILARAAFVAIEPQLQALRATVTRPTARS